MSLAVLAAGLLVSGCATRSSWAMPAHHGPVRAFSAISNSGAADVHVSTGRGFAVRVSGDSDAVSRLQYRIEGDTLKVTTHSAHGVRGRQVQLHVTMPALIAARVNGSGNISVDRVSGPLFQGSANGSGDLRVAEVRTASVRVTTSGSGNIMLASGTTEWLDATSNGSGNVEARGLRARSARVATSGSGNVNAWASHAAELASFGSGNAVVDGGARCRLRASGSGAARCG